VNRHLDEGTLQALLDGELPPAEASAAEAHLAACTGCAAELRALKALHGRLGALLGAADVPAPVAQAQMAMRRRRVQRQERMAEARRALLRAAVLVLGLAGAAAAATIPGSPVRQWIAGVVAPAAPEAPLREELAEETAAPAPAPVPPPAGVSILPDEGTIRVVLSGAAEGLVVRARLSDAGRAAVTASGAAAGARFRTGPGKIEVVGAGPGEVMVELPRSARAAFVEVNGRVYVAKDGQRLRVMAPVLDPAAPEPAFRVGS
jgi:Putative zinc-finger